MSENNEPACSFGVCRHVLFAGTYDLRRVACEYTVRRILSPKNDSSGGNDGPGPQSDALQNHGVRTDKDIITNLYRRGSDVRLLLFLSESSELWLQRVEVMVVNPNISAEVHMFAEHDFRARGKDAGRTAAGIADLDLANPECLQEHRAGEPHSVAAPAS